MEIITLIPTMGMLAYFVHGFVQANLLTPNYILILFIVSVLGLAWAIFTLFTYKNNTRFIGLVDLGFVGALIAGVYELRFVTKTDCVAVITGQSQVNVGLGIIGSASLNTVDIGVDKTCAMLKACFAFGIMNCIFFFVTAILALLHGGKEEKREVKRRRSSGGHRSRRSHSGRRSGSRSSHSHSRAYV